MNDENDKRKDRLRESLLYSSRALSSSTHTLRVIYTRTNDTRLNSEKGFHVTRVLRVIP